MKWSHGYCKLQKWENDMIEKYKIDPNMYVLLPLVRVRLLLLFK